MPSEECPHGEAGGCVCAAHLFREETATDRGRRFRCSCGAVGTSMRYAGSPRAEHARHVAACQYAAQQQTGGRPMSRPDLPGLGHAKAGPERTYSVGSYRFGRYGWRRWECTAHGRGVDMAPTPVHAFLRLRRWLKEPARPM